MEIVTDELASLLEGSTASGALRRDDALTAAGVSVTDLAGAKAAMAALALADAAGPEAAPGGLRARLLATMHRGGRYGVFADRLARMFDIPEGDANALCAKLEAGAEWMPFLLPGVEMMPVEAGPKHAGALATLVRLAPGASFPDHAHRGEETMFVLDGGFREAAEGGAEVWRGEELVRGDGTAHTFAALPGRPCIAAALVTGYADFL
jgi:quercetin dioxygenase-like cupin family protein